MIAAFAYSTAAYATPPSTAASAPVESSDDQTQSSDPNAAINPNGGIMNGLARSGQMLGDMGGMRTLLGDAGANFNLVETSEVLGNVSGGIKQGFVYDGLTQADLQVDTQRAFGLWGGLFNVSALEIHGSNLSQENLGTLQTASGIEADRALRLWELWYQQQFDDGKIDVKVGQQSADQEFIVSSNGLLFVNTMFGWPVTPSYDLPGGGPAYPLSAPAIRLRGKPDDAITLLGAVYSGSPVRNNNGDSQQLNPSGTTFPVGNGVQAFAEIQFENPANGSMVRPGDAKPLAGVYKLGVWYNSQKFNDQEFDDTGLSQANPATSGVAAHHRGDFNLYGVVDQTIWQSDEPNEDEKAVSFFARVMGGPDDRNLVTYGVNGGLTLSDPFEGRDDDKAGIAMGYAQIGDRAYDLEADTANVAGTPNFARHSETFVEATYQYEVFPWWQVQPDLQYVIDPGAGIANPNNPDQRVKNELVLGVRTNITF
jgi:porin